MEHARGHEGVSPEHHCVHKRDWRFSDRREGWRGSLKYITQSNVHNLVKADVVVNVKQLAAAEVHQNVVQMTISQS